jgi:ATP-dependent helicase HrpA
LPQDVCSGAALERWYRDEARRQPRLLQLTRDELMRHEAAGITTAAFPKALRLGGIDCAAEFLHEPGHAKDGLTVTMPIYALNQVSDERCDWLVPGMLRDKVHALLKSLPQRPRSRLVPLPDTGAEFCQLTPFAQGDLLDALLKFVRERTQLAVQRGDFKLDTVPAHLFMNLRVVDEHGRQLAMGRHLAALKAQWGTQARSAFQALASLKSAPAAEKAPPNATVRDGPVARERHAAATNQAAPESAAHYTAWDFGELPELMEVRKGTQTMVGFPALVDHGDHVEIEVLDDPDSAAVKHRAGLRRLVALQLREPLKYLEKNISGLQAMGAAYMSLGTLEELRGQIVEVALDRALLADPLPHDAASFEARLDEGRARLVLVAQEVARQVGVVLAEFAAATRKLRDARPAKEVADDVTAQLARLCGKRFVVDTPWAALQHLPRYLKAIALRLDKLRSDPARDAARLAELRPLEQRYARRVAERRGAPDARLDEYRWLLEELRVSFFAQELRTPQPVSVKRLDKAWQQLSS